MVGTPNEPGLFCEKFSPLKGLEPGAVESDLLNCPKRFEVCAVEVGVGLFWPPNKLDGGALVVGLFKLANGLNGAGEDVEGCKSPNKLEVCDLDFPNGLSFCVVV